MTVDQHSHLMLLLVRLRGIRRREVQQVLHRRTKGEVPILCGVPHLVLGRHLQVHRLPVGGVGLDEAEALVQDLEQPVVAAALRIHQVFRENRGKEDVHVVGLQRFVGAGFEARVGHSFQEICC